MQKHPQRAVRGENGDPQFTRIQITKKHVNLDTFENRLVRHILTTTRKKLRSIRRLYLSGLANNPYNPEENKALLDLNLEELKQFHPAFEQDVFDDLSMIACVEKRKIPGAPAPEMVQKAIDSAREQLKK